LDGATPPHALDPDAVVDDIMGSEYGAGGVVRHPIVWGKNDA